MKLEQTLTSGSGTRFREFTSLVCEDFQTIQFFHGTYTPGSTNIAMENGAFEDVFAVKHGDIPFLCWFTGGQLAIGSLNLLVGTRTTAPRPKPQLDAWDSKEISGG